MLNRGKLAVLAMLGLAAAAAVFGWWWNYQRGARCLAFYGSEAAFLIRTAATVELLIPVAGTDDRSRTVDLSRSPGLLNARASLLDDASYQWNTAPSASESGRIRVVRFASGHREVQIHFDFGNRTISVGQSGREATLVQKTATGWEEFLKRHD
jgi:hypothetical protein